MARNCDQFRDELARQTPVFDKAFLKTFIPLDSSVLGRHQTGSWEPGTGDTHFVDRLDVGYPNLNNRWKQISSAECGADSCNSPRVGIAMGSVRSSYFMEELDLTSDIFCLTKLLYSTRPSEQVSEWYRQIRKLPQIYADDFIRVNAAMRNTAIQIAGSTFSTFTPNSGAGGNVAGQLTTINLGGAGNLPASALTWPYLQRLTAQLALEGYSDESGLPSMMYNLITEERAWYRLTNGNPELREQFRTDDYKKASPLYKVGEGIQVPYGNLAPTISKTPIRFQHLGSGVLNRVYPNTNIAGTTGTVRQVNQAYLDARYGLSFLWHPKAIKVYTPPGGKLHEMIPTLNSNMFGKWSFINPLETNFRYVSMDGTSCVYNNDKQLYFYWLAAMQMGFQYQQPQLIMPILHLIDGSGKDCMVDDPICGDVPAYVEQEYSDDPTICEA